MHICICVYTHIYININTYIPYIRITNIYADINLTNTIQYNVYIGIQMVYQYGRYWRIINIHKNIHIYIPIQYIHVGMYTHIRIPTYNNTQTYTYMLYAFLRHFIYIN